MLLDFLLFLRARVVGVLSRDRRCVVVLIIVVIIINNDRVAFLLVWNGGI